jgi:hypothetical protein
MFDKDKVIQLAKEAGWTEIQISMASPVEIERLSRFYAIAFKAGMERAAEIADESLTWSLRGDEISDRILAETHAQNQPKPIHDSSVM